MLWPILNFAVFAKFRVGSSETSPSPSLALKIQRHSCANQILQRRLINLLPFVDVNRPPHIPFQARIKQPRRILQRSSLGKRHLHNVLVRLSRAHDAAM